MSRKLVCVALMALLTIFASSTWASEQLPTSENPALGDWTRMRPTSFAPTIESAREQCDRTARADPNDRLTPAHCERLEQQLQAKQCREVAVPDGVVFDHMNGRENGRSHLTHGVKKMLGRDDPAFLCDLGDRVFAYWFVGNDKSCHNIAVVFSPPPPVSGACGSRAMTYSHDATSWPEEGKFCASGTLSPTSIIFPEAGKTTAWTCEGSGGGEPDLCLAGREAPPKVVEAPLPKCGTVQTTTYTRSPAIATRLEPLFLNGACGPIYMPGINTYVPSSTTKTTTYQPVCVD